MFSRATIKLGIGPHSSLGIFLHPTLAKYFVYTITDIKTCPHAHTIAHSHHLTSAADHHLQWTDSQNSLTS